jgi:maltooligosyltrehalose trehalohydrolase
METVKGRQQDVLRPARHFSVGAELLPEGGVSFRVWAPKRRAVQVVVSRDPRDRKPSIVADLQREASSNAGYFSGTVDEAAAGMFYGFRLDDASQPLPDPASRFQPNGPLGLSQIVDPRSFKWTDARRHPHAGGNLDRGTRAAARHRRSRHDRHRGDAAG